MSENITFTVESNNEPNNEPIESTISPILLPVVENNVKRTRCFHDDFLYKKKLIELDITKESNIPLETHCLYFSYKMESKHFEIVKTFKGIRTFLINRQYLYEIVNSNGLIRFYIDLDPPDKTNPTAFSYSDIVNLCKKFIEFIKETYDYNCTITYSIQISITDDDLQNNVYKRTDKFILSSHIIFNIMTENVEQIKQVMLLFKNTCTHLSDHIDLNVYSYRKKYRAPIQQKEQVYEDTPVNNRKLQKFVLQDFKYDDILYHDPNIYESDFVSVIVPLDATDIVILDSGKTILSKNIDLFIDVILDDIVVELIIKGYNIKYCINQEVKLAKFINKIIQSKLTNNYYWTNILNLIITVIIMSGAVWESVLDNQNLQRFLSISKTGKYITNEYVEKNIALIKDKIIKKELIQHYQENFIEPLKPQEIEFIYNKLNMQKTDLLTIIYIELNKKDIIELQQTIKNEVDNTVKLYTAFYNQITRILILPNSSDTKTYDFTQYQFELELIKSNTKKSNRTDIAKCRYKIIEINTLTDYVINPRINTYQGAPVGAGKSYYCLTRDIISIMNDNPNNKILQITDGVVIAEKTFKDTKNTIEIAIKNKTLKRNRPNILHYNNKKLIYTGYDEVDIFVCCIDSIEKHREFNPTHVIIDEYTNVNKRISFNNLTANARDDLRNYYFMLLNTRILKLYDADIDDNFLSILDIFLNVEMTIYKLIEHTQYNENIILQSFDSIIKLIIDKLNNGKKLSISLSTSTDFAEKLADYIYTEVPVSGFLITSDGASEFGTIQVRTQKLKKHLSKDTSGWTNYDVSMWSPAVMCGVSFNDKAYYDCHFHIIELLSADATSNVQMMYRVRGNNEKTIYVAVKTDALTTLKNISVENMSNRRITNFNTLTNNISTGANVKPMSIKQDSRNTSKYYFKIDNTLTILANIQNIEEINIAVKLKKLLYNFFQTTFRYGSRNLICEFYNKDYVNELIKLSQNKPKTPIIEPEVLSVVNELVDSVVLRVNPKKIRTEPINIELLINNQVKKAFDESVMLETIPINHFSTEEDDPLKYSKIKTFFYLKYNISFYSWNYFNTIKKCIKLLNDSDLQFYNIEVLLNDYKEFNFPEVIKILKLCDKYSGDNRIRYNYTGDSTASIYNINTDTILNYNDNEVLNKAIEQQTDITNLLVYLYNIGEITQPIDINTVIYENPIDYGSGNYDNELYQGEKGIYNHISTFYKITNFAYFQVKQIIYDIFDNLLKAHTKIKLTDMLKNGTNKNDYLYFIEFIYGTYISFNIFDILNIDFNDLSIIYLNEEYIQPDPLKPIKYISGIIFEKATYQKQFDKLISVSSHYLDFILTERQIDLYKKDIQNRQALNFAFKMLNLTIELGEVRNNIGIIKLNSKRSYKYRTQQINIPLSYFHENDSNTIRSELNKLKISFSENANFSSISNSNVLDDVLFYLPQEQKTDTKQVSYPKIKLYYPYSNKDNYVNFVANNKNANTDYLRYSIELCCSNVNILLEKLDVIDTNLQQTVYYSPVRSSEKVVNIVEALEKIKNEKTQILTIEQEDRIAKNIIKKAEKDVKDAIKLEKKSIKIANEAKKELEKELKKLENAIKQKEKDASSKICKNCGREYILKNPNRHYTAFPDCKGKMK